MFHDGVVDGLGRAGAKGRDLEAQEIEVFFGIRHTGAADVEHVGVQPRQFVEIGLGTEKKHAAVPVPLAF